jgi:periplasmic divalent cation tolerance protein
MKIVLCTAPAGTAQSLASTLVEERLAACVNVVAGVVSTYRWRGKIESSGESLLVVKTADETLDALRARIAEIHEYETPEIVAIEVHSANESYLSWVAEETSSEDGQKVSRPADDVVSERGTAPRQVQSPPQEGTMAAKKKAAKKAAKKTTAKKTKKKK